jgi:hypothetical protein
MDVFGRRLDPELGMTGGRSANEKRVQLRLVQHRVEVVEERRRGVHHGGALQTARIRVTDGRGDNAFEVLHRQPEHTPAAPTRERIARRSVPYQTESNSPAHVVLPALFVCIPLCLSQSGQTRNHLWEM